jgi:S-adenosylmethionine:tRNA-ribosyltransferase-isomerase (queuine synthetase)
MAFFTQTIYTQKPIQSSTMRLGNYVFDTNLSLFGVMKQRVITKVNRSENILKLRNNETYDSVYPMLDEFGYMVVDFYIFKSTWDYEYHVEVNKPKISSVPTLENIYQTLYVQSIVKKYNSI